MAMASVGAPLPSTDPQSWIPVCQGLLPTRSPSAFASVPTAAGMSVSLTAEWVCRHAKENI
jgi:hypothetical protein